jgi:hypothetical protein
MMPRLEIRGILPLEIDCNVFQKTSPERNA